VQTRRVVRLFAIFGGGVSILAVLLYGIMRGGWLDAVLAGIALGMSMLPEEFPVVLTVFMAMGAWRISLARVLTRRAAAIETLGSATVLCTDKTGTLTENRMTIVELRLKDGNVFHPRWLATVTVILALTMLWPFANQLFAFGPLHADDLALALGAGVIALLVLEVLKPLLHPAAAVPDPAKPSACDGSNAQADGPVI
jgi:cation transport ATPase